MSYCHSCGEKSRENSKFCSKCGCKVKDTQSTGSLSAGSVIDKRYEIKKLIKSGGMGAIYQGVDKRFNNKCAIKEMVIENTKEESTYLAMRFQEEATILRRLHHPNLPRVIDYFIEKSNYYLVMDFIDGDDLEELLRRYGNPGLPEEKIAKWSVELLDVLDYLHNQDPPVIYRDMKPSNVMIRRKDSRVMLVDFGIARVVMPDNIETLTTVGTPHYASPEHFDGKFVPQSDLFSLGATLHHLLSGKVPSPCLFKPLKQVNPKVSEHMETIIMKSLELEIPDRFNSADEMKQAFIGYIQFRKSKGSKYVTAKVNNLADIYDEIKIDETGASDEETGIKSATTTKQMGFLEKLQTLPDMIHTLLKREVRKAISESIQEEKTQETQKITPQEKNIQKTKTVKEETCISIINQTDLPQSIINDKDQSPMILIPGGTYWMGNDITNPFSVQLEQPRHKVILNPYYIDKFQITNNQYCRFLNRKKMEGREEIWIYINDIDCKIEKLKNRYRVKAGYDEHPVVSITWYGAKAYAEWAEKRLPSEVEWEVAARGPERREFPWGDEWDPEKCANKYRGGCGVLMPVGSFPQGASMAGMEDMAGNVWEWCNDWLNPYPGSTYQNENFGEKCKVVRGGAWFLDNPNHFRSSFRRWYVPTFRYYFLGFRCCKDAV